MRVGDLYPMMVVPASGELSRDVSSLTQDEWGDLIGSLADLSEAYGHAQDKATEMWASHYPR